MGALIFIVAIVVVLIIVANSSGGTTAKLPSSRGKAQQTVRGPRAFTVQIDHGGAPSEAEAIRQSERSWVPPGLQVEVAGRRIPGGMIYVGKELVALRGYAVDGALIDPGLKVAPRGTGVPIYGMGYWPSYSGIEPVSRAEYLDWLSSGRRDPAVDIGYVFLFFYGIERRALFDAKHSAEAREELPALVEEVRQLLAVYGENSSFHGYASSFLNVMQAQVPEQGLVSPPAPHRGCSEVPFEVKFAAGTLVAAGLPIPAEWAFAWVTNHPDIRLRTPAQRCPSEFEQLFCARYTEKYGEGLRLKRNKTNISVIHRPASNSLFHATRIDLDVPDVTRLSGPIGRLRRVADEVQAELEAFSRWVGKTDDRESLAALAMLPGELARTRLGPGVPMFELVENALADSEMAVVQTDDILRHWPSKEPGKLSKQEAVSIGDLLSHGGYGIEPDVRFGGTNLSRTAQAVVFRSPPTANQPPTADLEGASALLHLGAAVALADGEVSEEEERHLEQQLESLLHLSEADRHRLRARLQWYFVAPPSTSSLKKLLASLAEAERHRIGRVLLSTAGADGFVSPPELKALTKIYRLLGLDPDALYGDVHEMATPDSYGPVTVLPADGTAKDFKIRPPQPKPVRPVGGVTLDLARVAAIRAETGEVSRVLGSIFAGEEAAPSVSPALTADSDEDEPLEEASTSTALPGLDEAHSEIVRALAAKSLWSRAEFGALAELHGLMLGGAIEFINEATFAACEEPMLEGDDPIEVNSYALEEIMA